MADDREPTPAQLNYQSPVDPAEAGPDLEPDRLATMVFVCVIAGLVIFGMIAVIRVVILVIGTRNTWP